LEGANIASDFGKIYFFPKKFKILRSNRILAGTEDGLHSEYPAKKRPVNGESVPYKTDARNRGFSAF
jgi:hypothetical protein